MPISTKRNGFYYFNNKEYPSITKVIQEVIAKPALLYWYGQQSARIALKEPELNEKEVLAKLQLKVRESQNRGKYIHSVAEAMPVIDLDKIPEEYKGYVKALINWWHVHQPLVVAREVEACSNLIGIGCRVDFIAQFGGFKWLIDFKTGKDIYKEVGLQLAAGKTALKESKDITIDKTGAVLLMETGEWQFKETNDTTVDLQNLMGLYNWLIRKG